MSLLTQRYDKQIAGVIECFDRIIISGVLTKINFTRGMSLQLHLRGIRVFDYATKFALPLRDQIRAHAARVAQENGLEIEYIRSARAFRKEDRIAQIISQRGNHPGLVHIFSAMETCPSYEPWFDKSAQKVFLRYDDAKCLHYYFYFIDPELGLCYLRVPTWSPFRLQFYCNGHNWLANQLTKEHIEFKQCDNTFVKVADFARAQAISDSFSAEILQPILERYSAMYCPVAASLDMDYYWSIKELEYATDIVFHRQQELAPIYQSLVRTAIHSVKPDNVATFLSRKLSERFTDEIGNHFHTRVEGTRIKHHMGAASIKMYDKHQIMLRIETTVNNVSLFKHHREVVHRDGSREMAFAPVKKTIHSLGALRELMSAANTRYIAFISELDDASDGERHIGQIGDSIKRDDRSYRGFNLFCKSDLDCMIALVRGEGNITGITNRMLRRALPGKTSAQISYFIKRCRVFGLIKKCAKTYKYYLTKLGRSVVCAALTARNLMLPPASSHQLSA